MSNSHLTYTASFKTHQVFNILNRGLVITGQITNGIIKAGNFISLNIQGRLINYQIDSVEFVDNTGKNANNVGLRLKSADANAQKHLASISGQVIKVFEIKE